MHLRVVGDPPHHLSSSEILRLVVGDPPHAINLNVTWCNVTWCRCSACMWRRNGIEIVVPRQSVPQSDTRRYPIPFYSSNTNETPLKKSECGTEIIFRDRQGKNEQEKNERPTVCDRNDGQNDLYLFDTSQEKYSQGVRRPAGRDDQQLYRIAGADQRVVWAYLVKMSPMDTRRYPLPFHKSNTTETPQKKPECGTEIIFRGRATSSSRGHELGKAATISSSGGCLSAGAVAPRTSPAGAVGVAPSSKCPRIGPSTLRYPLPFHNSSNTNEMPQKNQRLVPQRR